MGLKDALAVFDRRGVNVVIRSPHATITTGRRPKEGFPDVVTLQALALAARLPVVFPADDPGAWSTTVTDLVRGAGWTAMLLSLLVGQVLHRRRADGNSAEMVG